MRLYLLTRLSDANSAIYDCAEGFVCCAVDSDEARRQAFGAAGDEGPDTWTDATRSTCQRIGTPLKTTKRGILLRDFHAG